MTFGKYLVTRKFQLWWKNLKDKTILPYKFSSFKTIQAATATAKAELFKIQFSSSTEKKSLVPNIVRSDMHEIFNTIPTHQAFKNTKSGI